MQTIVATLKIKPGMEKEFEAIAAELAAAVRKNEPGNKLYALHRSEDPQKYVFVERYDDEAAIEAHRASDHYKTLGRKMGPCMEGRPEILRLTEV